MISRDNWLTVSVLTLLAGVSGVAGTVPPVIGARHCPPAKPAKKRALTAAEERTRCRKVMREIAEADSVHIIRTGTHDYTTDIAVLEKEAGKKFKGTCPAHGTYCIVLNDDGTFTVHCSVKAHDRAANGRTGFMPDRDKN